MYLLPKKIMDALTPEQLKEVRHYLRYYFSAEIVQSIQFTENPDNLFMNHSEFITKDLLIGQSIDEPTVYLHQTDEKEWQVTDLDQEKTIIKTFKTYFKKKLIPEKHLGHRLDALACIEESFQQTVADLSEKFSIEENLQQTSTNQNESRTHIPKIQITHEPLLNCMIYFVDESMVDHQMYLDTSLDAPKEKLIITFSYKQNDLPVRRLDELSFPIKTFK